MKRILIFLLLYMAFAAMSCYEDHSAKDFKIVKPIVIEFAGAEGFQQFLAAGELGAGGGNGGLLQQGEQGFPFLWQIVADGKS